MAVGADRGGEDPRRGTTRERPAERVRRGALAVVVLGAVAIRLMHLDQPVRYDEAVTYLSYVSRPLSEAVAAYDLPNNHVFHTVLVHLGVDAFGGAPWALRLPAFLAGVATVPLVYRVGREIHGADAGLLGAALAAASPALVLFSTNARGYALVVLAFLTLVLLARRLAVRRDPADWAGFVTVVALGAWTIPVMLYPAAAAGGWLLVETRRAGRRPVARVTVELLVAGAAALALTTILYLPVVREAGLDALVANRFVRPRTLAEVWAGLPGFLGGVAAEWTRGVPGPVAGLLGLGALVEAAARVRAVVAPPSAPGRRTPVRPRRAALLPVSLLAAFLVLVGTLRIPFARVWLFLLPVFLCFASAGLLRAGRWARGLVARAVSRPARGPDGGGAIAGGAVLLMLAVAVPAVHSDAVVAWGVTGSLPHGDRVAAYLARRWDPGDAVRASIPSDAPLEYYFRRRGLPGGVVNGDADPGACRFVVVNRRHGEEDPLPDPGPGRRERILLREWGPVAVYGEAAGPGASTDPCRE